MIALHATAALAQDLPAWLTERRIIGANDLEPIENMSGSLEYERTKIVARVETASGEGFCTAARVGQDLFLTNFHCSQIGPADSLRFHLGYERNLPPNQQLIFQGKEVLSRNLAFDYAVYRTTFLGAATAGTTKSYEAHHLAHMIPDNQDPGALHSFDVAQAGRLKDLKLGIKLKHPRIGDLTIDLRGPNGRLVTVHDRVGGTTADLDRSFVLADGLFALVGSDASGTWSVSVADHQAGDVGELTDVVLTTTTQDEGGDHAYPEDYPIGVLSEDTLEPNQPVIVASHPRGRFKEIDRSAGCKLLTVQTEVFSERQTLRHGCDTEGGSSGAPVIDRATGRIVAIHWGGVTEYNMGIPTGAILTNLRKELGAGFLNQLIIQAD